MKSMAPEHSTEKVSVTALSTSAQKTKTEMEQEEAQ